MPLTPRSTTTAVTGALAAATLALAVAGQGIGDVGSPLALDATAHPTHTLSHGSSPTSTPPGSMISGTDDETNVTHVVVVTPARDSSSRWTVDGELALRNRTADPLRDVRASVSADGATCEVGGAGSVGTLPGGESAALAYTCTYGPEGPGRAVEASATWRGGGTTGISVPLTPTAPR
jgi:hypothetical protein